MGAHAGDPATRRAGGSRARRVALATAMAVVAANVWTGSPLFALWVGSQVQGSGPPSMTAVFVVAVVLALVSLALMRLLAILGRAYDEATGTAGPTVRAHAPWLRSMRGERPSYRDEPPRLTALERVLVVMVVVATIAFEVWLLFYAGSPLGPA